VGVKRFKGLGDSNLNSLWRKAVLAVFGSKCFFCGTDASVQEVECHHIVKRKTFLLKYNYRNGIPACKWVHEGNKHFKMSCHQFAETPEGKHLINEHIAPYREYLTDRSGQAKQWLVEHGMTKNEYKQEMYLELQECRKGGGWLGDRKSSHTV
jgi:hypothetical protein